MDLVFDRGDLQNPRGHALLYFRVDTEPDTVYATYVVTLPVKSDLTKYVPPFLASHLGSLPLSDLSAFAMPPVPEAVGSYSELERLSQLRGDDLVYGGNMFSFDLPRMMETATEAVQAYSSLCSDGLAMTGTPMEGAAAALADELGQPQETASAPAPEPAEEPDDSYNVNEVLFSFMSESDKLAELSRLLGRLRFAVDGSDQTCGKRGRRGDHRIGAPPARGFPGARLVGRGSGQLAKELPIGQTLHRPLFPALRRRSGSG